MKKMIQVDHTVLGTDCSVWSMYPKVLLLALTILHYNIQKQKGIDLNDSLYLISCSYFIGFPSVGMGEIYYRLSQVWSG